MLYLIPTHWWMMPKLHVGQVELYKPRGEQQLESQKADQISAACSTEQRLEVNPYRSCCLSTKSKLMRSANT